MTEGGISGGLQECPGKESGMSKVSVSGECGRHYTGRPAMWDGGVCADGACHDGACHDGGFRAAADLRAGVRTFTKTRPDQTVCLAKSILARS